MVMSVIPVGLKALRTQRPLFADYILGSCMVVWGLHVVFTPAKSLSELHAWRWLPESTYVFVGAAVAVIGFSQFIAAMFLLPWVRSLTAVFAAAAYGEFALRLYNYMPDSLNWPNYFVLSLSNVVLFLWTVP